MKPPGGATALMRPDENDDDALFARSGRGDAEAFTRLVERHQSRLMAAALRMTELRALAEDVVQETFSRAWRDAPHFRPYANGRPGAAAWLSRVLTNLAIDHLRRPRTAALEAAPEPYDPAAPPDDDLIAREAAARVRAAVSVLPQRQRIAIGLTYDVGLSNAEGATAMETSVGAYELLLVRARRALRAALADDDASGHLR